VILVASEAKYGGLMKSLRKLDDPPAWFSEDEARARFRFDLGHPIDGAVYVKNPAVDDHYLLPAMANERLAQEKLAAFTTIAAHLGAKSIKLVSAESRKESKQASFSLPAIAKQLGLSVSFDREGTVNRAVYSEFAQPSAPPEVPEKLRAWLDADPALRHLAELRLTRPPTTFAMTLEVRDLFQLGGSVELLGKYLQIGGKLASVGHTIWSFEIEFWPVVSQAKPAAAPQRKHAPPGGLAGVLEIAKQGQYGPALEALLALGEIGDALDEAVCAQDGGRLWLFLAHARIAAGRWDAAVDAAQIAFEVGARKAAPELLASLAGKSSDAPFLAAWDRLLEGSHAASLQTITRFPRESSAIAGVDLWRRYLVRRGIAVANAPASTPLDTLDADACTTALEAKLDAKDWSGALLVLQRALDLAYGAREYAVLATLAGDLAHRRLHDHAIAEQAFTLALLALLGGPKDVALAPPGQLRPSFDAVTRAADGLAAVRLAQEQIHGAIAVYRDVLARLPKDYVRLRSAFAQAAAGLYRVHLHDEHAARFVLRRAASNS
jgi:hypothetical protein